MKEADLEKLLKLNPFSKTEYYPIKNKIFNGLLGGKGLPKGSILHIAGGSGTGKSTLVLHDIVLDLLKQGLDVVYIDADRGLNDEILSSTEVLPFRKNIKKEKGGCFLAYKKTTFSDINECIQEVVEAGVQVIVIDTLAVIDSGMYMGKDAYNIENMKVGGESKAIRQLMKNINVLAEKDSRRVNFILLNHTAKEIGGNSYGAPKETPKGGDAPIQYSDIVIQLYKYSDKPELLNGKPIGNKVYANVVKSRYATGKVKTPFFIRYGRGISTILTYKEVFEAGKSDDSCYISSKGRTYTLVHPKLTQEISYVGKDNLVKTIIENYRLIDPLFTEKDWMIDVSQESALLDIEYSLINDIKLPKDLKDLQVVTNMGDIVYFLTGVDLYGQKYGVYYDTDSKRLYKEFNSCKEQIPIKQAKDAIDEINKYLENINSERSERTLDDLLSNAESTSEDDISELDSLDDIE